MTTEQIKKKMQYGDYGVLAQMLGTTTDAARMQFRRGNPKAAETLIKIIENRNQLITTNQTTTDEPTH